MQAAQPPPSSWHSKVEPGSVESNEKLALVELVGFVGEERIEVSGAVVSIVHV